MINSTVMSIFQEGRELKSGVRAKMWTRRYSDFEGEFKLVTTSGLEEYAALLGVASGVVDKLKNDPAQKVTVCQKEGRVFVKHENSLMPARELSFRFGEEFDYEGFLGLPDKFKVVETLRDGDTIEAEIKGPRFTLRNAFKFTQNFLVVTFTIEGTGVSMKRIFEKVH